MRRRNLVFFSAITILSLALVACGEKPQSDPRTAAPLVRAVGVERDGADARSFTGTVAARVQSDLGFRVAGKVMARLVDAGQAVKRGQALMRIDSADLKLAASAQQEVVAAARARAQQTAYEESRYRALRGTGAISASAYDQAKAAADAARAQLSAAESQAEVARNANRYAELLADADGVVVETLAEPGQVVNAGQVVVRVAHAGRREAVIQLPETLRPVVGTTAQARLFGKEELAVPARLRQLSDAADRQTRTYEARYVLEGELSNAPLGATVAIEVPLANSQASGVLRVPIGALFDAGKGPGVWVLAGRPAKVSWRPVAVRGIDDDSARIAGSLKQGDRIVALGAHLLHEGDQVRVAGQAVAATVAGRP